MEKNGAISSQTPSCGCDKGKCKKAADESTVVYPTDADQANQLESDVTKKLVNIVKSASIKK